jgi:hypothetical protein
MELNTSLDSTGTSLPTETVTTTVVEPNREIRPPRSNRVWWLTGLLAVMSVAALIENIIFKEPNLVGSIELKKGDSGPASLFKKDAPLGPDGKPLAKRRSRGQGEAIAPGDSSPKEEADEKIVDLPPPPLLDSRTPELKKADEEKKATEAKKPAEAKPADSKPAETKPALSPAPLPKLS